MKVDLHDVAGRQAHVIAETESTGAVEMDVDIAGLPVHGELEVMMLDVFECMAHVRLAAFDRFFPEQRAFAVNTSMAGHRIEIGIKNQFGPDGAFPQLAAGQIEVVLLLQDVIGELVTLSHADTTRLSVAVDEVDAGDFRFVQTEAKA